MPDRTTASRRARAALIAALLLVLCVAVLTILLGRDDAPARDGAASISTTNAGPCIQQGGCAVDSVWMILPKAPA